ncbi:MAG TPA: hypothetical protein VGG02_11310 [Chthoniobacterales bacterium]|jgi:hypothetical protein
MSEEGDPRVPPEEWAVRRELGEALMEFLQRLMPAVMPGEPPDDVMRRHVTENFRQAVEKAAAQGIETYICWEALATWTEEGKERIGYFSRALACIEEGRDVELKKPGPQLVWSEVHGRAECLFEIGRVHAAEGDPEVARGFLLRARPLAEAARLARQPAGITHDDGLEGKIAELLGELPSAP